MCSPIPRTCARCLRCVQPCIRCAHYGSDAFALACAISSAKAEYWQIPLLMAEIEEDGEYETQRPRRVGQDSRGTAHQLLGVDEHGRA